MAALPGGPVPMFGELEFGAKALPPSLCKIVR
jgi:hypothetical protein